MPLYTMSSRRKRKIKLSESLAVHNLGLTVSLNHAVQSNNGRKSLFQSCNEINPFFQSHQHASVKLYLEIKWSQFLD